MDDFFGLPPNATPEAINSYIGFWLQYSYDRRRVYPNLITYRLNRHLIPVLPASFVFTHQDLAPRNILVDTHYNISLVDWQFSGWYPIYFEYVGMQNFQHDTWSMTTRFRWWIFSWISVGIYSRENRAMQIVRSWSLCDAYARCVVPGVQEAEVGYRANLDNLAET
jgi:thiamine kinase-like enzyme